MGSKKYGVRPIFRYELSGKKLAAQEESLLSGELAEEADGDDADDSDFYIELSISRTDS